MAPQIVDGPIEASELRESLNQTVFLGGTELFWSGPAKLFFEALVSVWQL